MMADLFELTESWQSTSKSMNYVTYSYAKCEGLTLSEAIKRAFFETVEEEYDLTEAKAVSKRIASGEEKTYSLDETERMLGL